MAPRNSLLLAFAVLAVLIFFLLSQSHISTTVVGTKYRTMLVLLIFTEPTLFRLDKKSSPISSVPQCPVCLEPPPPPPPPPPLPPVHEAAGLDLYDDYYDDIAIDFSRYAYDLLRRHQFPRNCAGKRFLVYTWRTEGFGSEILMISHALAVGLSLNRIVVFEGAPWFTHNERCANATDGSVWACWFASNLTACPLPATSQRGRCPSIAECDLKADVILHHLPNNFVVHDMRIGMTSHWIPSVFDIMIRDNLTTSDERMYWWRSLVVSWLLRLNERTAKEVKQNIAQNFPNGVPEMIFMHIRGSDKVLIRGSLLICD